MSNLCLDICFIVLLCPLRIFAGMPPKHHGPPVALGPLDAFLVPVGSSRHYQEEEVHTSDLELDDDDDCVMMEERPAATTRAPASTAASSSDPMPSSLVTSSCPQQDQEQQRTKPPAVDFTKDYYTIFGIARHSRKDALKKAWRHLSTTYHPDKAGEEFTETFQRLCHIHDVLSDLAKRTKYNRDPDAFPFPGDASSAAGPAASAFSKSPTPMARFLIDHVDLESLTFFAQLKASRYVMVEQYGDDEDVDRQFAPETLRQRCYTELLRHRSASKYHYGGIFVPYKEDALSTLTEVQGRLTPGVNDVEEDLHNLLVWRCGESHKRGHA